MGKLHSTSLSYNSPTLRIKLCLRAWTNAASQGFSTRLSRKRISAGLKPSRSASNCHSFPPEMPSNNLQNKSNSKLFQTSQATFQENSHYQIKCKIKSICDLIIRELSWPRHASGSLRVLFCYRGLLHNCFFAQIVQSDFCDLRNSIVISIVINISLKL